MSYHVFFSFSSGLNGPILVPAGTLRVCQEHVARVERVLGFKATKYLDNPAHWTSTKPTTKVDDKTYCKVVEGHNEWVRWLYEMLGTWKKATPAEPPKGMWERQNWRDGEWDLVTFGHKEFPPPDTLTPEDAQTFWHGLVELDVPPARWTREHYVDRMEHIYAVMRGREHEGVTFNAKQALSPKQASAVVGLFAEFLDANDCRLDVPNGHDYLASSYDGGYDWCERCGPVHPDAGGCRKKACPLVEEFDEGHPDGPRQWVLKDKATKTYLGRTLGEWPTKIGKRVLHFLEREAADKHRKQYTQRALVLVPVRVIR